ncbi:hypothetical protein [Microbacterium terrisoli]|jgi:galactose-1-phosphate uridylyltransferase|uniref:hypothetical protein n=1 Tax=Microbacterium terrisoli TaxID=3242192 RepID=UPI002803A5C7|nr:hypothetical protein [Microbacterium protaetiae]
MSDITFVQHDITARVPELTDPTSIIEVPLRVRVDPLTGRTARIITGTRLAPETRPDLTELTAKPAFCPFCADRIQTATGTFDASITDEGRIQRGTAVVVPNVMAYSEFSSVGVYDTAEHFFDLPELTPTRVGDLLQAFVAYTTGVHGLRPMWSSVNANYLPPSGSSLIHPHGQSAHDDVGTTIQRELVQRSAEWPGGESYWDALIRQEEGGERWIGRRGRVAVLTPWAPVGFHEVWAVVPGAHDITDLTDEDCADLGTVMSTVFQTYYSLNLTSFNWAMYGGGPAPTDRYSLLLRIVSRSNVDPFYRSDVTYFEHLHAESMVDISPEEMAGRVRERFA